MPPSQVTKSELACPCNSLEGRYVGCADAQCNPDKNLGTTFRKLVGRTGVESWPKPFQNGRSSQQTELEQTFSTYMLCSWLGNSPAAAHKPYLTVIDQHLASASKTGDSSGMQAPMSSRDDAEKKTYTYQKV